MKTQPNLAFAAWGVLLFALCLFCACGGNSAPSATDGDLEAEEGDRNAEDAEPIELDSDCPETSCEEVGGFCDGGQYATSCEINSQGCLEAHLDICFSNDPCSGGKCVCLSGCDESNLQQTRCAGTVVATCTMYGGNCGQWVDGEDCAAKGLQCQNGACLSAH